MTEQANAEDGIPRPPASGPDLAPIFATAVQQHRAGRLSEAERLYRQILAADPQHAESLHLLGVVAQQSGRSADAVALIGQAILLRGDDPFYHANLAGALRADGRPEDAERHFRRALLLKPDFAEAYSGLGCVLLDQGRLDAARRAQQYAITLQPQNPTYFRRLLDLYRVSAGDPYVAALDVLARDVASLPEPAQAELHFALGKAYADLQQYQRAFHHYLQGNALKRREFAYDEYGTLGFLDRIRTIFSPELFRRRRGFGDPSKLPVFIVGMPRSGTTLVEQILAGHPQVFAAGELDGFPQAAVSLRSSDRPLLAFPEVLLSLSGDALHQVGSDYIASVAAMASGAARCTDKMPANSSFVGLIHLALPNARIIHVQRHPIDTCISCFTTLFESGQPFSYDLAELGRYYRSHAALMDHWRHVLPPDAMLELRYEDVVADVETQARRIVAWCGLEWHDACLTFHQTQRPVRTASAYQVRQPIYRTSVDRWRVYREFLGPLLKALGVAAEPA